MSKPLAVILTLVGWAGVILVQNFSKLVPHASEEEVQPFVIPSVIFALVCTALLVQTFMRSEKR
jgi:hypothetical protein